MPPKDEIWTSGISEISTNEWRYLKRDAKVETSEMTISADEIDYNSDTSWAYARGHVHMEHYKSGVIIDAEKAEFNIATDEGKFYGVTGTAPAKIMSNPYALTTTNPFYFQARWVDRIKTRYILHHGFVTDCKLPKPWWIFQAPVFDIVPGDRAIARSTLFRLKNVPILYLPYFRRPLGRNPRQSGFLTPNFGNTSRFGFIYGLGYYLTLGRSYDMTGVLQYFSDRGPAVLYNFRGKPNVSTDFNFNFYTVRDRGTPDKAAIKEGGTQFELTARTRVLGFNGYLDLNYLSSYLFRQTFSYSFTNAISSEIYSLGFLQRHFKHDAYTFNITFERDQLFESITLLDQPANQVIVQRLPGLEFNSRDQNLFPHSPVPLWWSVTSSGSVLTRSEPSVIEDGKLTNPFETGALGRITVEPRVATAFQFKSFSLLPSLSFRATDYTSSYTTNSTSYTAVTYCGGYRACPPIPTTNVSLSLDNLFRRDLDFGFTLGLPTVERVFVPPAWLHLGGKLKHVIETNAAYEYVTGVNNFGKTIRFDKNDVVSDTNQLTLSLTNRIYRKKTNGDVDQIFSWRIAQARYFDPTFGGAVISGTPGVGFHNVVLPALELTPFTFLDRPRQYSPVDSYVAISPWSFITFTWRADYDPLRRKLQNTVYGGQLVNSSYGLTGRFRKYFASVSDNALTTATVLLPQAHQTVYAAGYGSTNSRGWNVAGVVDYDRLLSRRIFDFLQLSYNTNCCGFSFELRQFNLGQSGQIGSRNDNQYLFSFSVANLGTFGSLQRQGRIF